MATLQPAVQLYTLRDQVGTDFPAVLKAIKEIGYMGAELAGYGSLGSATEVKKAFNQVGLVIAGAHVGLDAFEKDVDGVIRDAKTLGFNEITIPWLDESLRRTAADWRAFAIKCNAFGTRLADAGLHLNYHNHAFEFEHFDSHTGFDIFLQHSDPKLVGIELDVFWVKHAGVDPTAFIETLGRRLRLIHLKDMTPDGKFAPVGTGTLNFQAIVHAAAAAGVKWGIVEQDDCYGQDPIESVRSSFTNLKKLALI